MRSGSGTVSDPTVGLAANFDPGDGSRPRYNTLGSLVHVPARPLASERTLGIIISGQSTGANWGSGVLHTASEARAHQLNIMDGRVYPAASPMLGADGTGNSPGSAIGDYLIGADKWDRVTTAVVGFGTTSAYQWAAEGGHTQLTQGLKAAWAYFVAHNYRNVIHLHQQGEFDAASSTPYESMLARLRALDVWRRAYGLTCPMYVSKTTFAYGGWITTDPDPANWTPGAVAQAIRAAQAACVNGGSIRAGADTDQDRGSGIRSGAHWDTQAGAVACAVRWAGVIPAFDSDVDYLGV